MFKDSTRRSDDKLFEFMVSTLARCNLAISPLGARRRGNGLPCGLACNAGTSRPYRATLLKSVIPIPRVPENVHHLKIKRHLEVSRKVLPTTAVDEEPGPPAPSTSINQP